MAENMPESLCKRAKIKPVGLGPAGFNFSKYCSLFSSRSFSSAVSLNGNRVRIACERIVNNSNRVRISCGSGFISFVTARSERDSCNSYKH